MAIDLWLESGEDSLTARRVSVREALSRPFEAVVLAASPRGDLDLETIVGRAASVRLAGSPERLLRGVVRSAVLVHAEPTGLSTYELQIVHRLWLLSQRKGYRIFQHRSVPEIAREVLAQWGIAAEHHLDPLAHPKLEYRVQYGESDLAFVSRLLEEAGITCICSTADGDGPDLVLTDSPERAEPRPGLPIPFVENATASPWPEFLTNVQVAQQAQVSRVIVRDFDFRHRLDLELSGTAQANDGDPRFEHHHYRPGAFGTDEGAPRDAARAGAVAQLDLAAERAAGSVVTFETSVLALRPGTVFAIADHPHPSLASKNHLLVTELVTTGAVDERWKVAGSAVPTSRPYKPPRVTPKPRALGVESAIVVGPEGQAVHTDELGRVRVQFHWDRTGREGDGSSCWIRVSQGWAGAGFGLLALPRVGHEVLVSFLGGDPDQPIVVGRVFNGMRPVPYKLPEHATRSTWRSETVPDGGGWNEIMFEDARGRELLYVQAERNLEERVKVDETISVGRNRSKQVAVDESEIIGASQTTTVGANRIATVGAVDSAHVGLRHSVTMAQPAGASQTSPTAMEMVDRKITLTTGEATITLEGPNITLDAAAGILLNAASEIAVHGRANIKVMAGAKVHVEAENGEVVIQGGPLVQINPERGGEALAGGVAALPVEVPPDADIDDHLDDIEENRWYREDDPDWFQRQMAPGGAFDPLRWGKAFEDFGFFNLGVVARAAGIPAGVLLRQAGLRHTKEHGPSERRGDPGNGLWGGKAPFGNEPKQHDLMKKGISYFDANHR